MPCAWVLGFQCYFALRCIALLCVVCVRLHLVLLWACEALLPSLSVTSPILCASLGRSGLYALARGIGRAPLRGLSCPSAEVV
jgi:hypothetical protein